MNCPTHCPDCGAGEDVQYAPTHDFYAWSCIECGHVYDEASAPDAFVQPAAHAAQTGAQMEQENAGANRPDDKQDALQIPERMYQLIAAHVPKPGRRGITVNQVVQALKKSRMLSRARWRFQDDVKLIQVVQTSLDGFVTAGVAELDYDSADPSDLVQTKTETLWVKNRAYRATDKLGKISVPILKTMWGAEDRARPKNGRRL